MEHLLYSKFFMGLSVFLIILLIFFVFWMFSNGTPKGSAPAEKTPKPEIDLETAGGSICSLIEFAAPEVYRHLGQVEEGMPSQWRTLNEIVHTGRHFETLESTILGVGKWSPEDTLKLRCRVGAERRELVLHLRRTRHLGRNTLEILTPDPEKKDTKK